jgi:cell division septation protein DedD
MQQDFGPRDPIPQFLTAEQQEKRPRRRLRGPLLVVLVMGASAGGVWIAYTRGHNAAPGEVPLIQAEQGATKTRPQQPGGMAIPDQDKLVYNQGKGAPQVEKLLPPPEAPLPRPSPPAEANALPAPEPAAPPASATAVVGPTPAPVPAAPAPATVAAPAAPTPITVPPAAPPPAKAALTTGGGFRLQLGALRSEEAARQEWERIHRANGDVLGNLTAAWPRADLGERGIYYRIQTAPIADGAAAERLCGELKRRNIACILVRP